MVCLSSNPAARAHAPAPRLAPRRSTQHRLVCGLRRDPQRGAGSHRRHDPAASVCKTSSSPKTWGPRWCVCAESSPVETLFEFARAHRVSDVVIGRAQDSFLSKISCAAPLPHKWSRTRRVSICTSFLSRSRHESPEEAGRRPDEAAHEAPLGAGAAAPGPRVVERCCRLVTVSSVGGSAQSIIRDNYRSVLAAQRMKEAIERHGQRRSVHHRRAACEKAWHYSRPPAASASPPSCRYRRRKHYRRRRSGSGPPAASPVG